MGLCHAVIGSEDADIYTSFVSCIFYMHIKSLSQLEHLIHVRTAFISGHTLLKAAGGCISRFEAVSEACKPKCCCNKVKLCLGHLPDEATM